MNRMSGLILSEIVTALLAVVVFIAVAFGIYVSKQRDNMVASAQASIVAVAKHAAIANESGEPIVCDNSLVDSSLLVNRFLSLTIKPTKIDNDHPGKGYGAGIYVHSKQDTDSDDTFVTALRLYKALKKKDENSLRLKIKEEDEIEYSILVSGNPSCIKTESGSR